LHAEENITPERLFFKEKDVFFPGAQKFWEKPLTSGKAVLYYGL
jgi:hypothetical protein